MNLILQSPLPPYRGGIAQFGSRLKGELEKLGNRVVPFNYSRLYPGCLFPGKTQLEEGGAEPHGPLHGYNPMRWTAARKAAANEKPDGIVAQWWHPFFAPCLTLSTPGDIPSVAVCHNVAPHEKMPMGNLLAGMFLKRQKALVVHSADSRREASKLGPSVIELFHPIYDQYKGTGLPREEAREALGLKREHTALLFFGLVREYKGLDILVEACESLPENFRIIAAGENYTGRNYSSDRMFWKNSFIPDNEVGTWFNAADIVVLPYRTASQSGIAQIALAFEKPLVVTPVGGLPEVVRNGVTGTVSRGVNPEALARAVRECREFSGAPETPRAVRELAQTFSWSSYAKQLLEAFS